jgi:hypothetical protein
VLVCFRARWVFLFFWWVRQKDAAAPREPERRRGPENRSDQL